MVGGKKFVSSNARQHFDTIRCWTAVQGQYPLAGIYKNKLHFAAGTRVSDAWSFDAYGWRTAWHNHRVQVKCRGVADDDDEPTENCEHITNTREHAYAYATAQGRPGKKEKWLETRATIWR